MKALTTESTDLESIAFFSECKDELQKLSYQLKAQKAEKVTKELGEKLEKIESSLQRPTAPEVPPELQTNICLDLLRCMGWNYSYGILLRESSTGVHGVLPGRKLSTLLGIEPIYDASEMNTPVLEIILKQILSPSYMAEKLGKGVQTEGHSEGVGMLGDERVREIRREVEERERQYYEGVLEEVKKREGVRVREEVRLEFEHKYKKDKEKIAKEYSELIKRTVKSPTTDNLAEENNKLLEKNYDLQKQINTLKQENESYRKESLTHDCKKSEVYLELLNLTNNSREQLEKKKKEYDLALRNMSTKVEDLFMQKKKLENQNQSDEFFREVKVRRENKDYMIDSLYAEVKQMNQRVQVLADENNRLRDQIKEFKGVMKSKEEYYSQIKEESLNNQNFTQNLQSHSNISLSLIGHSFNNKTIKISPENNLSWNKPSKDICVSAREEDIINETEPKAPLSHSEDSYNFDEGIDVETEYKIKIERIRSEMDFIKKKIEIIVCDEDF